MQVNNHNRPFVPPFGVSIPQSKEDRELLKKFVKETSKDFVEMGYNMIKELTLLGFDACASWAPTLKELAIKDYELPQIIIDSRNRMHCRWEKLKKLGGDLQTFSQERFELDRYTSLHVLHAVTGMKIPEHEHQRYQEILDTQRSRESDLVQYFEEFRQLPPDQQCREALKMVYYHFWNTVTLHATSMTYNMLKHGVPSNPPSFKPVTTHDVHKKSIKSLTLEEIRNIEERNLIYVGYEHQNEFVLKFAHRDTCNHVELARLPTGEIPKCKIAGQTKVKGGKIPQKFGSADNRSGHLQTFGEHLPKLTTNYFHSFGLTEMNEQLFQSFINPFYFNIMKGHVPGIKFRDMVEGVEYQYVRTNKGLKVGPMYHQNQKVTLGQLALSKSGEFPEAILSAGSISRVGNELKELQNCLVVTKEHFIEKFWKVDLAKELKDFGFSEVNMGKMKFAKDRHLGPKPKVNPPIYEPDNSIHKHGLLEAAEKLSKVEDVPHLLEQNLDPEERVAVYQTVIQDAEAQKVKVAPEKAEELINHFQSNKEIYAKAAGELARELASVVNQYFYQEERTTQYEQRREQLSREFDQLSALFDLKWSIDSFQSARREEILPKIQSKIHVDSFESQMMMIREFTREVCEHSDRLKKDLETYIESCNKLDSHRKTLKQMDQSIKEYYDHKLKKWAHANHVLNKLTFFTGSAHGVSAAIQMLKASATPVTAGLAAASVGLNVASGMVNRRQQNITHNYENQLNKHKEVHNLLGVLSDHELNERLKLEQDKRAEGEFLLQNRDFVLYETYQKKQQENLQWLQGNTDAKNKEITEKEKEIKRLQNQRKIKEQQKQQYGNVIEGEKKINEWNQLKLEIENLELQEKKVQIEIDSSKKIVESNEKLEKRINDNLNVRKHVSALVKYREELEANVKPLTEEEIEERKEFKKLLKRLNHGTELWYKRAVALQGGLRPIAEELDWWTESRMASSSLNAVMEAYKFGVNGYKIYNFNDALKKLEGKGTWEKLGKVKVKKLLNKCILPALSCLHQSMALVRLAWNAYYGIKNPPRKDLHIETLKFFVEQNQKLLDLRLEELQRNQNLQHSELLEQFGQLKEHFKEMHYRFDSAALIDMDNTILDSRQKFERRINKIPILETIALQLQHARERNLNGSNFTLGETPCLDQMIHYPYMYTGFLQIQLETSRPCSSLYLWDSAVHQLIRLSKELSGEEFKTQLEAVLQDLSSFEELMRFPAKKVGEAYRLSQGALKELEQRRDTCHKLGVARQSQKVEKAIKGFKRPQKPLGSQKFFINNLVHKVPMKPKEEQLTDSWVWNLSDYFTHITHRSMELVTLEPLRWFGNQDGRWTKLRNLSLKDVRELNPITIVNHDQNILIRCFRSMKQILEDPIGSNRNLYVANRDRPLELSGWTRGSDLKVVISSTDDRHNRVTEVVARSKISGPLFSEAYSYETIKKVEVAKEKLFLELEFQFKFHSEYKIEWDTTKRSRLKKEEISKVPSRYLVDEGIPYDTQLNGLIEYYHSVLEKGDVKLGNSEIFPAQREGFVPLALPKEVVEVVEKQIQYDRFLIEVSGIGTLISSYDFSLNEKNDFYELALIYHFSPADQNQNTTPYCKFIIASIDRPCVNAWKNQKGEPEWNELLIQWLMTETDSGKVGMPGKRSLQIQNGEFLAPAEEPFPGLYNLMKKEPGIIQTFDSSKYQTVNDIIHNQPYRLEFFGIEALKVKNRAMEKLNQHINNSPTFKDYRHAYNLVMAYCRLCSSLEIDELASGLDSKLHLIPPLDMPKFSVEITFPRKTEQAVMAFEQLLMRWPSNSVKHIELHKENIMKLLKGGEDLNIFESKFIKLD